MKSRSMTCMFCREDPRTSNPCVKLDGKRCTFCVKLDDLEDAIVQAKISLEKMFAQHRALKSDINQHHDPIIHRLPPELSSHIFSLCLPRQTSLDIFSECQNREDPVTSNLSAPLVLGAVCKRWREIAWATPQLWAVLSLDPKPNTSPTSLLLVREWLDRSCQIPLYIRVRSPLSKFDDDYIADIIEVICDHIHHCKVLCLFTRTELMVQKVCPVIAQSGSLLENISFLTDNCIPPDITTTALTVAPKNTILRQLRLSVLSPRELGISFENLTEFTGTQLFLEDIYDLIHQAPQLKNCILGSVVEKIRPFAPRLLIIQSQITRLLVSTCPNALWNLISLPSLLELHLPMECQLVGVFMLFLARSGCKLRSLSISQAHKDMEGLARVLHEVPSVERLSLFYTDMDDHFFQHFVRRPVKMALGGLEFLPNLQYLCITGDRDFQWSSILLLVPDPPSNIDTYCRPLSSIELKFYASNDAVDVIDRETLQRIVTMIDSGIDIAITDFLHRDLIRHSRKVGRYEEVQQGATDEVDEVYFTDTNNEEAR